MAYISPAEDAGSATWQRWERDATGRELLAMGVWTEKKHGLGEDAEPLFLHHRASARGLLAVFDGAGGAGAGSAGRSHAGVERTSAWVGARIARAATEEWFLSGDHDQGRRAGDLHSHLVYRLRQAAGSGRRKIVGTMRRELPTTMAALEYGVGADHLAWQVLSAGDSRCFLLTAAAGLQQLSQDDTDTHDALTGLTEDPPMTNLVSADRDFRINAVHGDAALPAVLVCATDGFFGYVQTPADFEHVLLDTLMAAIDTASWCERLVDNVCSYTGDDASLVLLAAGFACFEDLQARFGDRHRHLTEAFWLPMRHVDGGSRDELVAARSDSWERYRGGYEERLPRRREEARG